MTINKTHINQCSDFTTSAKSALFKTFEEVEGGGGGSPAGEDRELQLNDNGAFGGAGVHANAGDSGFTFLSSEGTGLVILGQSDQIAGVIVGELGAESSGSTFSYNSFNSQVSNSEGDYISTGGSFSGASGSWSVNHPSGTINVGSTNDITLSWFDGGQIVLDDHGVQLLAENENPQTSNTGIVLRGGMLKIPYVTVDQLPVSATPEGLGIWDTTEGCIAVARNGRKAGEAAGMGTGCLVWSDGTSWYTAYDNSVVQD